MTFLQARFPAELVLRRVAHFLPNQQQLLSCITSAVNQFFLATNTTRAGTDDARVCTSGCGHTAHIAQPREEESSLARRLKKLRNPFQKKKNKSANSSGASA